MEDKVITEKELQKVIKRLLKEKKQWEDEYRFKGEEDGFEWAKLATIEGIRLLMDWDASYSPGIYIIDRIVEDAVEGDELMEFENPNYLNSFAHHYFCGWIDGVNKFWGVIKNEILLI